ncbi:hypothetical protein CC78DRAFT_533202 [Lojkania enalia]|uniref:Uncharacterized protein n=1 Tax=Lojkania enalia TaxID=147567 RepID=A0A9P4K831_9PLEO|nr:hypothetical protein CC78DRAFT_533202 [Didymosphaeria enalia]
MATSAPSSVSRYRPAILALTGAAAAYAAYLVYTSVFTAPTPSEGLHRSNAVRRPRARPRRSRATNIIQQLQQNAQPLGEVDFLGTSIVLDPRHVITPAELHEIAHHAEPTASPEFVESVIAQFYDTFLDRLLALTFPGAALIPAEREAITHWLSPLVPNQVAVTDALHRHSDRFGGVEAIDGAVQSDEAESIAPTELSWQGDNDSDADFISADGQILQRTLYHIAEDRARQEGVIHRGITCNGCGTKPIHGVRWRCANCADFDLCSDCEATNSHIKTHIFYKVRIPAPYLGLPKQEPVYPGRPHVMSPSINSAVRKRLLSETKMESEEIEALWDQFTCLAGTEFENDHSGIGWALDRRAFNQAFVPRYSSFISSPNLIYDRIFAYYDTDHNGLIGFLEFVKGLDGMHSTDPKKKYKIVFNGYDVDGDGYISRKDVLRIFRAYYAIEKEATRNYLTEAAEELSVRGALETIHSSQPLGSAFTHNGIPARNPSNPRLQEKTSDDSADLQPIHDDIEDVAEREEILRMTDPRHAIYTARGESGDQAVRDRWVRRQFYIDEEEGLTRPEGVEDASNDYESRAQTDEDVEPSPIAGHERPRGSRSSSRVRFQDDVEDIETRSNASNSSRPFGERWGGYEIPEPEKDLGKEVLYQITQQAFNELLNPLFQEKEDNAMDALATRAERRRVNPQVEVTVAEFNRELDINKIVVNVGIFSYAKRILHIITGSAGAVKVLLNDLKNHQLEESDIHDRICTIFSAAEHDIAHQKPWPDGEDVDVMDLWNAKLCRMQLRTELEDVVLGLATNLNWLSWPSPTTSPRVSHVQSAVTEPESGKMGYYRDPTMPQFRPNSAADLVPSADGGDAESVSEERASSSDSSDRVFIVHEDDVDFVHFPLNHCPFFINQAVAESSTEASRSASPSEASHPITNAVITPQSPPPPPPLPHSPSLQPPTPPPPPPPEWTNDPIMFYMWIDTNDMELRTLWRPVSHALPFEKDTTYKPLERKIRRAAMDPKSPCHMTMLASLEAVEAEISERKGSGLVNFKEFEEKMAEGKLRFLEAWMDWVSF